MKKKNKPEPIYATVTKVVQEEKSDSVFLDRDVCKHFGNNVYVNRNFCKVGDRVKVTGNHIAVLEN